MSMDVIDGGGREGALTPRAVAILAELFFFLSKRPKRAFFHYFFISFDSHHPFTNIYQMLHTFHANTSFVMKSQSKKKI